MSILYIATRAGDLLSAIAGALVAALYLDYRAMVPGDRRVAREAAADG
jgi:hypothetical protein